MAIPAAVLIHFTPGARNRLAEVEAHHAGNLRSGLFDQDFAAAMQQLAEWAKVPALRPVRGTRQALAFHHLPCVLTVEIQGDSEVLVHSVFFVPQSDEFLPAYFDRPPAGIPRRFSLGMMLGFTLAFAALLGVLRFLALPAISVLTLMFYFAFLAAGQSLLFGGRHPRLASILVGTVYCPSAILIDGFLSHGEFLSSVCGAVWMALTVGPLTGYLLGGLLAALFLRRPVPITYRIENAGPDRGDGAAVP